MTSCGYKHHLSVSSIQSHFSHIWTSHVSDLAYCLMTDLCLIVSDPISQSPCPVRVHQPILLPLSPLLANLVRNLPHDQPTIICADVSLPVLQCLLTLVYNGKCVLTSDCTLSDLQILMQNLGMGISNIDQETEPVDQHVYSPAVKLSTSIPQLETVIGIRQLSPHRSVPSSALSSNSRSTSGVTQTQISQRRSHSSAQNLMFQSSEEDQIVKEPPSTSTFTMDSLNKCQDCGKIFPSSVHLIYHMHLKHPEDGVKYPSMVSCRFCKYSVRIEGRTKRNLLEHLKTMHAEYTCNMCGETFIGYKDNVKSYKRFLSHNSEEHQDKASFSVNFLTVKDGEHSCTECISSFSSLAKLYYHTATKHVKEGTKEYKCKFCSFSVKKKNLNLIEHLMIHTGEKDQVCRFCGKEFRARKTLVNHERLHTEEKKYECDKCDARFVQLTSLKCHTKTHHKLENDKLIKESNALMCTLCGKVFKYVKTLENHKKLHNHSKKQEPFSSSVAALSNSKQEFATEGQKKESSVHPGVMRSKHTKENLFACHTCPVKLNTMEAKTAHEKKHTQSSVWAQCANCSRFYQVSRGSCRCRKNM